MTYPTEAIVSGEDPSKVALLTDWKDEGVTLLTPDKARELSSELMRAANQIDPPPVACRKCGGNGYLTWYGARCNCTACDGTGLIPT